MSRILRRPMFRGGRVDSRGTGITSGLDKPKRGLVNEPGGYAGQYVTGAELLAQAQKAGQNIQVNPKSLYSSAEPISGFSFFSPSRQFPSTVTGPENNLLVSTDVNYVPKEEEDQKSELDKVLEQALQTKYSSDYDYYTEGELPVDTSNVAVQNKKGKTTPNKDSGSSMDTNTGKINTGKGLDEPTVELTDLQKDIAEYEKILGLEKAKKSSIYDFLAGDVAPAFLTGENLREAAATALASQAKRGTFDKPAKISETAGLLGIKGKQASDLAKSKAEMDAYKQALKTYAPVKEKKLYEFLKTKMSDRDAMRIALGDARNFAAAYNEKTKDLGLPKLDANSFKTLARDFYGDLYVGDIDPKEDTTGKSGAYTIKGTTRVVILDKGKVVEDLQF